MQLSVYTIYLECDVWQAMSMTGYAYAKPIQESPLAVCDAQSIAATELVASDFLYRGHVVIFYC